MKKYSLSRCLFLVLTRILTGQITHPNEVKAPDKARENNLAGRLVIDGHHIIS